MWEEFMKRASDKIDAAVLTQKSTLLNLVSKAYDEGKRNAETDRIAALVADALDRFCPLMCIDCKWFDSHDTMATTGDCHNPRFGDGHGNYSPPCVDAEFYCSDGKRAD